MESPDARLYALFGRVLSYRNFTGYKLHTESGDKSSKRNEFS